MMWGHMGDAIKKKYCYIFKGRIRVFEITRKCHPKMKMISFELIFGSIHNHQNNFRKFWLFWFLRHKVWNQPIWDSQIITPWIMWHTVITWQWTRDVTRVDSVIQIAKYLLTNSHTVFSSLPIHYFFFIFYYGF